MIDPSAVIASIRSLDRWITRNGYAGYDPYDIRGQDAFINFFGKQTYIYRKIRGILFLLEYNLAPRLCRRVFRIKKRINAKGMGLLATSYLSLYRSTSNKSYLEKAESVLDWLYSNPNSTYDGYSWGYPFHWQSRVFFPRGTPSSVVTGTVGDAWLDHFLLTDSKKSLEVCRGIARFFLNCLNRHSKSDNQVCFSYTPLDNFKVHNASLFVANFLARLGEIDDNNEFKQAALNAVRYTLAEQNSDGSFNYWGGETSSIIDHYHTGFVLRHLDAIRKALADDSFDENIDLGYDFYRQRLFNNEGIPKFTPDSLYPIDIHSCSEAILTLSQMEEIPQDDPLLAKVIDFNSRKMLSAEGYYIAEIRKRFWGEQKVKIPYMRWGQCWMLLSLARLYETLKKT
jgi:hypothetical protein